MNTKIKTELILNFLKEHNLTKKAFCSIHKMNITTLNKVLNNQLNINTITAVKIAKAVNIKVHELFE